MEHIIVDGQIASKEVLVSKELQVDTLIVEQLLQAKLQRALGVSVHVHSLAQLATLQLESLVLVRTIGDVERFVCHGNDPRPLGAVLVGALEVLLDETILPFDLLPSILGVVVEFRGEHQKVSRSNVDRPEVVVDSLQQWCIVLRLVPVADHRETSVVVRKVSMLLMVSFWWRKA